MKTNLASLGFLSLLVFSNVIANGDESGQIKFSGTVKNDFGYSISSIFLNKNLEADQYNWARILLDLNVDYESGAKNGNAVAIHSTLRSKSYWGNATDSFKTDETPVVILPGTLLGSHNHGVSKPAVWVKDLWFNLKLHKLISGKSLAANPEDKPFPGQTQKFRTYLRMGLFPYYLGNGIALGGGYGTSKDFLGIYNKVNDFCAPGILLTTSLWKKIFLDLYFSKFESKSASPRQTLSSKREKLVGTGRTSPWAGAGMDDNLYSLALAYKFDFETGLRGKAFVYGFYNDAPGKTVELAYDSKSDLITVGCGTDATVNNFDCGFEIAFNFGSEQLYQVDRNQIEIENRAGTLTNVYSHIYDEDAVGSNTFTQKRKALVTTELKNALIIDRVEANDKVFTDSTGLLNYKTKENRIRPAYTNNYRGFMLLTEAAYNFKTSGKSKLRLAGIAGLASGDEEPHTIEKDKNYNGFVGLNECYSGRYVKSLVILDERNVKRPMTLVNGSNVAAPRQKTDGSFSDIMFAGIGFNAKPEILANYAFDAQTNLLTYFKYDQSFKVDIVNNVPTLSDTNARSHLGTELNLMLKLDLVKNLSLSASAAVFVPGGYYFDIAGARIKGDAMSVFEQYDLANIPTTAYSISSDPAYYFNFGISYKF